MLVVVAQQVEKRTHSTLRRQPRGPLPGPARQLIEIAGELSLGERNRIGARNFDDLQSRQRDAVESAHEYGFRFFWGTRKP